MTVLDPLVSTRGEMGPLILTVLGMVAQMDDGSLKNVNEMVSNEQNLPGYTAAENRGLNHSMINNLQGEGWQVSAIAKTLGCFRMQVYRVLAKSSE